MHGSTKSMSFLTNLELSKGVNLAKLIEDRLAFVFGESRPKFCHEAGLLLLRFVTKRTSTFLFSVFWVFSLIFS